MHTDTHSRLCEIHINDGSPVVVNPVTGSTLHFSGIEAAFDAAIIADTNTVVIDIVRSHWCTPSITMILDGMRLEVPADYWKKAYATIEACYVLLCREIIDKHLPVWVALQTTITEYLTQYGPVN